MSCLAPAHMQRTTGLSLGLSQEGVTGGSQMGCQTHKSFCTSMQAKAKTRGSLEQCTAAVSVIAKQQTSCCTQVWPLNEFNHDLEGSGQCSWHAHCSMPCATLCASSSTCTSCAAETTPALTCMMTVHDMSNMSLLAHIMLCDVWHAILTL